MTDIKKLKNIRSYHAKTVICGDSTVGKTALCQGFYNDGSHYPKTYLMTTGVDLNLKAVAIPGTPDSVEVFMYDVGGKDTFKEFVQLHLHDAQLALFVYDVTNRDSYESIPSWHKLVLAQNPEFLGAIIANKVDLVDRIDVMNEEGLLMAQKLNLPFFQASAKDFENVEEPFLQLAQQFYESKIAS